MKGVLIGVNTWKRDKAVSEGLNFAISTETILKLATDVERRKFLLRPDEPARGRSE